jgi:AraC family transcriptional activator of pobA
MDAFGNDWYKTCMNTPRSIPAFSLFGESGEFPDVIHCETISARAGLHDWAISPHRHPQIAQVFVIEDGRATVTVDGAETHLTGDEVLFIPAQIVHGFTFSPETEGRVISIPQPVLNAAAPSGSPLARALGRVLSGRCTEQVRALADQIETAFAAPVTFREPVLSGLAQALLGAVAGLLAEPADTADNAIRARLQRLDELIARHAGDGWGPCDYATALSITTGHLGRLCRAGAGCGAGDYIEAATMAEARRLLAFTRIPVAEVGYRLGFQDPSYFSRRFRRATGKAPSAYRDGFGPQAAGTA